MGRVVKRRAPQFPDEWVQCAVRYLARFDRTAAQVERFLRGKGASPAQAKQAIRRLSDLRYLDDRAYAARWIQGLLARAPMGRERLKAELLARGLSEGLVDAAIREALQDVDEATLARLALRLKRRKGGRLLARQAVGLLRRRGFEEDTIESIMGDRSEIKDRDA